MMSLIGTRCAPGLMVVASLLLVLQAQPAAAQTPAPAPAPAQAPAPAASVIDQLTGPDAVSDLDVAALRKQAADRIQARAEATALRRPPIAPQLMKLPQVEFEVVFDPDSSLIRPQSYQVIGRVADALSDPKLLPYEYLVVYHTEAAGNRKDNLALSQRRADSIRFVLASTFKISGKRLLALGLGEEQLKDPTKPTAPVNARAQIIALGRVPPEAPKAAESTPGKKAPPPKKRRRGG